MGISPAQYARRAIERRNRKEAQRKQHKRPDRQAANIGVGEVGQKADYVRTQARKGAGEHHCHWPGCTKPVPPAMWGCKQHWFRLPAYLRTRIWLAYRPGQEADKRPSAQYIAVARDVQTWIAANYPNT